MLWQYGQPARCVWLRVHPIKGATFFFLIFGHVLSMNTRGNRCEVGEVVVEPRGIEP